MSMPLPQARSPPASLSPAKAWPISPGHR
jgi:hypothetical protein